MARKKVDVVEENFTENISFQPMEEVMGERYAIYAKYVIQDRAIPDVRDGLKPVQRRIIYSMFRSNNVFNKPTRKCAHTVGAVMGTFHPHGDASIYDALARMSQDWKVRYPLIDFQGNNGSIDGDSPAAYRYTESRLSELSNELIRDIDKKTVDMQLNFDDTEFEPTVLPARFPNLFANGTEGIAVAMATEIPPHNLKEIIGAVIYRIGHKTATAEKLMQYVLGPDFPGGGIIYQSEGLKNMYLTGRGRIEVSCRAEIVENDDNQQIIITEIPYKAQKNQLVFEIDKIIHSKAVDGLLEVRDESDWNGIRIVVDCKKEANGELLLRYLKNKTGLVSSYSANMVAIVNGRPKTLDLLTYVDAYIAHQVEVETRKSRFELEKFKSRLHIVEGLIEASLHINEVVEIIKKSKDKADSKVNLMKKYDFSNEQAEAIVTMPLYKLSHTDETILENEKKQLVKNIAILEGILGDEAKLNRVIIRVLKSIADKYGDNRRTSIEEKEDLAPIDKRKLIAKEDVMIALTRDGYLKRSSLKSYRSSSNNVFPGLKEGDELIASGKVCTTDYLICFTNQGNYICVPVHKIVENKWKEEGAHLNAFSNLESGEKIIKGLAISEFKKGVNLAILTKKGQIKRMPLNAIETRKRSRPICNMRLADGDEVSDLQVLTGNSNLLVLSSNGYATYFNENELKLLTSKAGGVKSMADLGKNIAVALIAFDTVEKNKVIAFTNKGHYRILDNSRLNLTPRLGKSQLIMPCFKKDVHKIVSAFKIDPNLDLLKVNLFLNNNTYHPFELNEISLTDMNRYAKKNINIPSKTQIINVVDTNIEIIDEKTTAHPVKKQEKSADNKLKEEKVLGKEKADSSSKIKKEDKDGFVQISIFDDPNE
ncbi:MAG TPA: DNA topoisomerase 4 subunit A [Erysipelotrichaceae bacterium]|nr:DNA topoisomerase 4 subunit A [Erysipelotrichaceae bacterium]